MKLVEMKCKNCGAKLKVEPDVEEVTCKFCETTFKIDDEVQHVKYDDMEQSGYEFEKGRLRAQREHYESTVTRTSSSSSSNNKKSNKDTGLIFLILLCICLFPIGLTILVMKSNLSSKVKAILVSVIWGFVLIVGIVSMVEDKKFAEHPWTKECTPIETFKYTLEDDGIIIDEYNGSDYRVRICSNYIVSEKEYSIKTFSGNVFLGTLTKSVILPDSIKTLPWNALNSSSIQYVYIPSSIINDSNTKSFVNYLSDIKEIIYGGNEEQWKQLINNVDQSEIKSNRIFLNVKVEDLKY